MCVPDQATLVLVVNKIQSVVGPGFLDLLDVFLESHLSPVNRGHEEE